jgi:hypothetical protein
MAAADSTAAAAAPMAVVVTAADIANINEVANGYPTG